MEEDDDEDESDFDDIDRNEVRKIPSICITTSSWGICCKSLLEVASSTLVCVVMHTVKGKSPVEKEENIHLHR